MSVSGWIGVDLDGTLAEYHGWGDGGIGKPIPAMVNRVKAWLEAGVTVKIVTARVGFTCRSDFERNAMKGQRDMIDAWCLHVFGQKLEITASKDLAMIELWDDRAVQVIMNTGEPVGGSVSRGPECAHVNEAIAVMAERDKRTFYE